MMAERREMLLRKRELLLKKAETKQPNILEKIGLFAQSQFPEIVEEAAGKTSGLIPKELSSIGAKIKESVPGIFKPALETAAETIRGGVLPSFIPGGRTTLEKPGIASRTAGLIVPATRIPELAGIGTRLGVQQIIPPEESPVPGFVGEAVGALGTAGIRGLFRTARQGNKIKVLASVKNAVEEATISQKKLSSEITGVFESSIGSKSVNANRVSQALKDVPSNVQSKILKEANVFKIETLADGSIKPDARNVWRLRQALDDFLTSKDFIEASKASKQVILSARRNVAKILSEVDPKIKIVMKKFSDFMDSFEPVKRILTDNKGKAVANKIISAAGKSGEPAQKIALEKFGKDFISTQKALDSAKGFLRGTALKNAIKRGAIVTGLGAIGGGVARRFIGGSSGE